MRSHPLYAAWSSMKGRCLCPTDQKFPIYGARGIRVCERWASSFSSFVDDMGQRPDGTTLERIDTNGHYEPGNCRWATQVEQQNNRRNNRRIEHGGESLTLAEWARRTGINQSTIWLRLRAGWTPERALTEPGVVGKNQFSS